MVLHGAPDAFAFAERIASSGLVPAAYRGKPVDLAIAVMYGNELGLPPMTALQRVVVISGKPTLDAQGFVSLIRQAGHSISGEVDSTAATVVGKRFDTGDTMTVTFTMEDAQRADLLKNATYRKFPTDMLWARAVTQLARRLFPDVMLAVSYAPEEMQAVADSGGNGNGHRAAPEPAPVVDQSRTLRPPPGQPVADGNGEIVDAEVIETATAEQIDTFKTAAKASGITTAAAVRTFVNETLGRNTVGWNDLTSTDVDTLMAALSPAGDAA